MTYSMVSIVKKLVRGKPYYYARECRRVDGKPKIVWQKYLGKAEDIVAALGQPQPPPPVTAVLTEFGDSSQDTSNFEIIRERVGGEGTMIVSRADSGISRNETSLWTTSGSRRNARQ